MLWFGWISADRPLPAEHDLRQLGWLLAPGAPMQPGVLLVDGRSATLAPVPGAERSIVVDCPCAKRRARLLAAGHGDATAPGTLIDELAIRARRLSERSACLPRRRRAGPLVLDLLHRDACHDSRWLGLHPREFALLWRLAENPGQRVSRRQLLRDVWRMRHDPETNSLEVHVSRLRARLASARLSGLVLTDPAGGYRLAHGLRPPSRPEELANTAAGYGKG